MGIVMSIREKIEGFLGLWIEGQAGYLIHYNSNLSTLRREVQKLRDIQKGVQPLIDDATRKGEVILPVVESWRTDVDRINEEVERFLKDEVGVNNSWLNGWCPDLRSRYSLSKEATKKRVVVIELQGEGSFERVSYPARPPGIEHTATGGFVDFQSRKSVMEDIMAALKDDKVDAIGVCGLGGTGKTTTVKEVGKRAEAEKTANEESLFDVIVMATISQTPNLKKIQVEIANLLGLNFPKGELLPARARRLHARLMNCKRVLVILDDLWKRLDLEEIGIPFGGDHKGCKLLLASRSQDVCNEMETDRNITIDVLFEVESWNLFKDKAGDCIDSPDIHPIAKDVLNECGRLPIAIVTVGRALRNKKKHVWNDALRQLRKSCPENISQSLAKVYRSLEFSYNFLEIEEERLCLLLCSMFKEDTNIQVKELVEYMMRLRILKGVDGRAEASDRVHKLVDKLKSCYLLLDVYTEWYSDKEEYVKMHDVIRDVIRLMVIGKQYTSTSPVSYSAPPLREGMEDTSSRGFVDFESRRPVIEQIMAALKDDDVNAIGIVGMGGAGKTTVAKEVCNRAKVEKLFAVIAMATVGGYPDVKEMQDEIAEGIGLKFNEESLSRRAERLRARLMDCERVIVVLDDVWKRLDLEAVGIPIGGDHKGCKLMLTSRNVEVCRRMETRKIFQLNVLTGEETWNIWKEMSGNSIESPDLRPIAMEVADTCAGLPLLVFTVGTALANKNKDIWDDALRQLRMPTRGGDDYAVILECIKLSYNLLESQEAKSCLLLCSIFEEDTNIPMEELVKYGMALRLFHGVHDDAVEEARHRLHSSVHTLQRRHLLLHCDKKERIRMHDLVHHLIRNMVNQFEGE